MIPLPSGTKIWLVAGTNENERPGCESTNGAEDDPMSGHVFIFRAAAAVRLNCCGPPVTDCLLTKRLERGRFAWPSARDGKVFLTQAQLAMLLEGIDWRQPKRLLTPDHAVNLFILVVTE
ncbi:IS66 family insertion sequence hypothetical protein (plasmid) [Escherichia coli]|uniref:IS66 family insertion sequence element accessory protein TnpB n=1 Tax=Escherichia coli TaxID=562 RepID=UPI0010BF4B29|nr:IS66 family insertion sequence element accessory protein TnpB [Escherichia coli]QCL23641.1 IS66 family insertion sequence hypothetical protein [Escherichia coli]